MSGLEVTQGIRLLVVDRNDDLRHFFEEAIAQQMVELVTVPGLIEAKGFLQQQLDFDLLLILCPETDGLDLALLQEIVQGSCSLLQTQVITDTRNQQWVKSLYRAGVSDCIQGPVAETFQLKLASLFKQAAAWKQLKRQNRELEQMFSHSEAEKEVARFTFNQLRSRHHEEVPGVQIYSRACSSLNGDFAICRCAPNGNVLAILADATGHGLSAAISIMPVVTIFGTMVAKGFDIAQILLEINRKLLEETPIDRFVAALVLELDVHRSRLNVWNGGMPEAYWVDGQGQLAQRFPSRHMALGILPDAEFDVGLDTMALEPKGFFFACSDGVTEQRNPAGQSYGKERLLEFISGLSPDSLLENLQSQLQAYAAKENFDDDISLCLIDPVQLLAQEQEETHRQRLSLLETIAPFSWCIRLCGSLLERQSLPPLITQYLQTLGMPESLCKVIFTVTSELVNNALDHGLLGLDSSIKEADGGFLTYLDLRQSRLEALREADAIELSIELRPEVWGRVLEISVKDTGPGYDIISPWHPDKRQYSGRGIGLVSHLFDELEILPPGNHARARLNLIREFCE